MKKNIKLSGGIISLTILLLSAFMFTSISNVFAKEDQDSSKDSEESGATEGDENGNGIPDELENWENPYETPADLAAALETAQTFGTCWDFMNAKYNLIQDETRYWTAVAEPDSTGSENINKVLGYLFDIQLNMGKSRLDLEKIAGSVEACEENSDLKLLTQPLEDIKLKMRRAGWLIDSGDSIEITDATVAERCTDAQGAITDLGENIDALTAKLNEKVEAGEVDGLSNAKELLNMAQNNFGNAITAFATGDGETELTSKMRYCSGAYDEAVLGLDLFGFAQQFNSGEKKDGSTAVEDLDAKIKLFLGFIAQQRVAVLATTDAEKDQIIEALDSAKDQIVVIQVDFAQVKYTTNPDLTVFDDGLEEIKAKLKEIVALFAEADQVELSDQQVEKSAEQLSKKVRQQINALEKLLDQAVDEADTEQEENILLFVEQTALGDATNARDVAKGYRQNDDFASAQEQAYIAIITAQLAKDVLKEVE